MCVQTPEKQKIDKYCVKLLTVSNIFITFTAFGVKKDQAFQKNPANLKKYTLEKIFSF